MTGCTKDMCAARPVEEDLGGTWPLGKWYCMKSLHYYPKAFSTISLYHSLLLPCLHHTVSLISVPEACRPQDHGRIAKSLRTQHYGGQARGPRECHQKLSRARRSRKHQFAPIERWYSRQRPCNSHSEGQQLHDRTRRQVPALSTTAMRTPY